MTYKLHLYSLKRNANVIKKRYSISIRTAYAKGDLEDRADVMNRKIILPAIPSFVIRFIFGEMSAMILKGSRISSEKIEHAGFEFQFPF